MTLFEKWIPMADPILRSAQQMFCIPKPLERAGPNHKFFSRKGEPVHPMPLQNDKYVHDREVLRKLFYSVQPFGYILINIPIKVTIAIIMPYRKLDIKAKRTGLIPYATTPDIDNSVKMYFDALQPKEEVDKDGNVALKPGTITDDKLVVHADVSKWRGPHPGIYLKIEECDAKAIYDMIAPVAGWQPETLFEEMS